MLVNMFDTNKLESSYQTALESLEEFRVYFAERWPYLRSEGDLATLNVLRTKLSENAPSILRIKTAKIVLEVPDFEVTGAWCRNLVLDKGGLRYDGDSSFWQFQEMIEFKDGKIMGRGKTGKRCYFDLRERLGNHEDVVSEMYKKYEDYITRYAKIVSDKESIWPGNWTRNYAGYRDRPEQIPTTETLHINGYPRSMRLMFGPNNVNVLLEDKEYENIEELLTEIRTSDDVLRTQTLFKQWPKVEAKLDEWNIKRRDILTEYNQLVKELNETTAAYRLLKSL